VIHYLEGDATQPRGEGFKIIAHVCNDVGAWGAGFVLALSRRWKEPEMNYRYFHSQCPGGRLPLGRIQTTFVRPDLAVVSMIAMRGVGWRGGKSPLLYNALSDCLQAIWQIVGVRDASLHTPRIGCGLAGGEWPKVEALINRHLSDLPVYVYDLPKEVA